MPDCEREGRARVSLPWKPLSFPLTAVDRPGLGGARCSGWTQHGAERPVCAPVPRLGWFWGLSPVCASAGPPWEERHSGRAGLPRAQGKFLVSPGRWGALDPACQKGTPLPGRSWACGELHGASLGRARSPQAADRQGPQHPRGPGGLDWPLPCACWAPGLGLVTVEVSFSPREGG